MKKSTILFIIFFILLISSVNGLTISNKAAGTRELNDPVIGGKSAPVTITWFTDYQGPFDARFYLETFPLINEKYIKTGKVKIIVKDFPLTVIHKNSKKAAVASNCANEQGYYEEFLTEIFEERDDWIRSRDFVNLNHGLRKVYKEVSQKEGYDQFNRCLISSKYNSEIDSDIEEGNDLDVTGVPTFFLSNGDKTTKIVGAQPFTAFEREIENLL